MSLAALVGILLSFATVGAEPPVFEGGDFEVVNAKEGVVLEVKCSANGDPLPQYKWYNQDQKEIDSSYDPSIQIKLNGKGKYSALVFNVTRVSHTAIYSCAAENSHGLRTKTFEIFINGTTDDEHDIIKDVEVINVTDSSVTFRITSIGDHNLFDVNFIEKAENVTHQLSYTGATFTIDGLIPSGHYTFQFAPKVGEESVWTKIYTVVLVPGVPDVIFRSLYDGVLSIEWFSSFDDFRRNTIHKYHLSYYSVQIYGGNEWKRHPCEMAFDIPRCFGASYTIANLIPKTFYEIVLKAHTSAGYGEPYVNKIYIP